jgi:imidazolonepropionase-like amidohydrolase
MIAHAITANLLIPGRGEPIENGVVIIEGKTIVFVGTQISLPEVYNSASTVHVPILMPGLWDCHVHFLGAGDAMSVGAYYRTPPALAGARGAADMAATLGAGFTSVREMAGYGIDLAKAVEEGTLAGPNIYSCNAALSQTGGHADAHEMSLTAVHDAMHCAVPFQLCDGVDECLKAVRLQLRRGAKVIKVCTSGGVTSEVDDPTNQQFSNPELKAIVEEAARARRIVAAHCHGKPGIMAALQSGCSTIEHGTYLDDESMALMKEKGAILVPTRTIIEGAVSLMENLTGASKKKLMKVHKIHREMYKKAVSAGVKIALGSDLGSSTRASILSHGNNGRELQYAVNAGFTPLQAIEAATANGPSTLGPQAPLSGQLQVGYDADLIALSLNPLEDISAFVNPENITHVWKGGKVFKSPSVGSSI